MDTVLVTTQEKAVEVAGLLHISAVEKVTEKEYEDESAGRGGRGGRNGAHFGCGGYRT